MSVYFIATRHDDYRQREFEEGSTVIDPFRYVEDQEGVKVHRIGQSREQVISLLVPSRARPKEFKRMVESAWNNATYPGRIEVVAYLDLSDVHTTEYPYDDRILYLTGERILLSQMWNECYALASGDIVMHCGDDIVFETPSWDQIVRREFAKSEDKILLVHGDDRSPNTDLLATHGFLHRRWVEAVGYFLPPYFSSDWNDVWLTEVADMIGRRVKVPIVTEHMHYSFGKRPNDETDRAREARGRRDDVVELYKSKARERKGDAIKLKEAMA